LAYLYSTVCLFIRIHGTETKFSPCYRLYLKQFLTVLLMFTGTRRWFYRCCFYTLLRAASNNAQEIQGIDNCHIAIPH